MDQRIISACRMIDMPFLSDGSQSSAKLRMCRAYIGLFTRHAKLSSVIAFGSGAPNAIELSVIQPDGLTRIVKCWSDGEQRKFDQP